MKRIIVLFILLYTAAQLSAQTKQDYYIKAIDLYGKEDYKNALLQINQALLQDSTNADYLLFKGNTQFKLKQHKEAYETFTHAIELHPTFALALNDRGLLFYSLQEFDYAINDFNQALKLNNPDSIQLSLYLNRGSAKINSRDFQGAYNDFMAAFKLDSVNMGVLNNLAAVCDEVGKGDQTLVYLNRILKIDSTFIGAYANIGFKYQEMGDYPTAIKYYDKVVSLDPSEPLGYSNRAYNKYKLKDMKGAMVDIEKSIQLYPTNSYAFRIRALIYIGMEKMDNACRDINKALELGFTAMYGDEVEKLKQQYCIKSKL